MATSSDPGAGDAPDLPDTDDPDDPAGDVVDLDPPDIQGARFGLLGAFWRYRRYRKKVRRKAKQGYVMWFRFDGTWPEPKFVKPESNGAGLSEVDVGGKTYLFTQDAMLPHARTGTWVAAHHAEDGTPINLRDPDEFALDPGMLQNWRDMTYETEPPGFFDKLDFDLEAAWKIGLLVVVGVAVLYQVNATLL